MKKNNLIFIISFLISSASTAFAKDDSYDVRGKDIINAFNCSFYLEWILDEHFHKPIDYALKQGRLFIKDVKQHQLPNGNFPEKVASDIPFLILITLSSSSPDFSLGQLYGQLNEMNKKEIFFDKSGNSRSRDEIKEILKLNLSTKNCNKYL